ncbi:MAG: lipid A biosynthesis acyltransferase [Sideroxydans sp.]|nr:lipid A biosynthesis acyltransferase [Sideroxydans sp.]
MTRAGIFIMWLLHGLPLPVLAWFGNFLGLLLYMLGRERRRVAHINLGLCFPDMPRHERKRLVRRHFQAFGRSFIERGVLWWSSAARIRKLVRVTGLEHYTAAAAHGPVILLVPHFVALDVGWSWLTQHGNLVSMYSNQKDPYFHKQLLQGRLRFGQSQLYARQQGLRPIIKAMRGRLPFYYLPDQDLATRDSLFIPFFGVPAATLTTIPRLAEITGARVVPCIARMLPDAAGYEVHFYPAWDNYPIGDLAADTRRVNEFIEQRVREMPEQYFWLHKRFKTRPEGEEKLY